MRVMSFPFLMPSGRQPGLESPSDQGRGTKWSVATEGVWQRGDAAGFGGTRAGRP